MSLSELSRDLQISRELLSSSGEWSVHLVWSWRRRAADMADYSSVAPPSSNAGGGMNDAFKDALQRARQVNKRPLHPGEPEYPNPRLKSCFC